MTDVVLDASVVVKWFHTAGEERVAQARALRAQFENGDSHVLAPALLWLEIINVAARRWSFGETELEQLARSLTNLGFEVVEPELGAVARWAARGLTAYDAAYVAVAEHVGARLITDDSEIVHVAPGHVTALGDVSL